MDAQTRHYENKLAFEIDSWDLQVALDSGDAVVVVDARSTEAFAAAHIPGAISLPHRTMSAETTSAIDRNALVVTYCDGIGCNASTQGALKLSRLGFRVRELIGGLDWWRRDGHATQTSALMQIQKANISDALSSLSEHWSQQVVAEANGQLFKVAKGVGSTNWHKHDDQDELFLIQSGALRIELRDRVVNLGPQDVFVVPKGVEHRPVADEEVEFLIVGLAITSTKAGGKPN